MKPTNKPAKNRSIKPADKSPTPPPPLFPGGPLDVLADIPPPEKEDRRVEQLTDLIEHFRLVISKLEDAREAIRDVLRY